MFIISVVLITIGIFFIILGFQKKKKIKDDLIIFGKNNIPNGIGDKELRSGFLHTTNLNESCQLKARLQKIAEEVRKEEYEKKNKNIINIKKMKRFESLVSKYNKIIGVKNELAYSNIPE